MRGTLIENVSGIDSNQYRDGTQNALTQILELMNAGTTAIQPLLAKVDKDRYLHIYQRQAESPEYLMKNNGQLETLLGQEVKPSYCINAAWVRIKDIPDMLGGLSAMRNFFIESAEYDVENDRTIYRPAGAFEPIRLAKWLGVDTANNYGSRGTGGGFFPPYHTHPASGGITDYLLCEPASSTLSVGLPDLSTVNASAGTAISTANLASGRITITATGLYWASIQMMVDAYGSPSGYKYMEATGYIPTQRDYFYYDSTTHITDSHKASLGLSFGFYVSSLPYYWDLQFVGVVGLMGSAYGYGNVSIVKLA